MPTPKRPRVIVVCTGNLNRSPFLAALLFHAGFKVGSCGTSSGAMHHAPAAAKTRRMAFAYGLDLTRHRTQHYTELPAETWRSTDLVVAFNKNHVAAAVKVGLPAGKIRLYKVADPGFITEVSPKFAPIYEELYTISKDLAAEFPA